VATTTAAATTCTGTLFMINLGVIVAFVVVPGVRTALSATARTLST